MLFGIQISVFNICLFCGQGDMYEHGFYHLDLLPCWTMNEEGASKLYPSDSLMRLLLIDFLVKVEVRRAVMTLCSPGITYWCGYAEHICLLLESINSPFQPLDDIVSYINLFQDFGAFGVGERETKRGEGPN